MPAWWQHVPQAGVYVLTAHNTRKALPRLQLCTAPLTPHACSISHTPVASNAARRGDTATKAIDAFGGAHSTECCKTPLVEARGREGFAVRRGWW